MTDVLIIGCGVVGAACAYTLSRYDLDITVLEKASDVAAGTTKANSAIIHAGYDPLPGTRMAALNVRGAQLAQEICSRLDVPYIRCGSLVLAFDRGDLEHVQKLYERGIANGVPGLCVLDGDAVRAREPRLAENVVGALWAPSSAIVNPWEYALAMAETAVLNGVRLHLQTRVTGIEKTGEHFTVHTNRGSFEARCVISAAGVDSGHVRSMLEEPDYRIVPTRGQYFLLDRSEGNTVGCTVFQCPNEKGKGVLVSPTVHGNLIVGPDAEPVEPHDTSTTARALKMIGEAARRSVPSLDLRPNIRNFAGVRANSRGDDFIIEESEAFPGFIDLAGIKSPGLSAAPAIGEYVAGLTVKYGIELKEKAHFVDRRTRLRFNRLSDDEKNELIARDSSYGRIICRCEGITEGEIVAALRSPIPPRSINGVKRRCGAGMGRCQGGFCSPRVHELIVRELGLDWLEVCLEDEGSNILVSETKEAAK